MSQQTILNSEVFNTLVAEVELMQFMFSCVFNCKYIYLILRLLLCFLPDVVLAAQREGGNTSRSSEDLRHLFCAIDSVLTFSYYITSDNTIMKMGHVFARSPADSLNVELFMSSSLNSHLLLKHIQQSDVGIVDSLLYIYDRMEIPLLYSII